MKDKFVIEALEYIKAIHDPEDTVLIKGGIFQLNFRVKDINKYLKQKYPDIMEKRISGFKINNKEVVINV